VETLEKSRSYQPPAQVFEPQGREGDEDFRASWPLATLAAIRVLFDPFWGP